MKAVFFDLGGTLLHGRGLGAPIDLAYQGAKSAYDSVKAEGAILPSYPIYLTKVAAAFMTMGAAGGGLKELDIRKAIGDLFADMGAPLDSDVLNAALSAWHAPFAAEIHADPKAFAVLEKLRTLRLRMGVITNSVWPETLISTLLQRLGLRQFFEAAVSSADVGLRKPSPTIFETALKRLEVTASESAYVGDRRKEDVVGAQQVGMRSVLLASDSTTDPGPEPDAKITSLDALPAVLASWV